MRINEELIRKAVKASLGRALGEARSFATKRAKREKEQLARDLYGDEYDTPVRNQSERYGVDVRRNADVGQVFALGNKKLSDDTLIINFTSALGCPSMKVCPVTQRACYAVSDENRLPDTRRKNLIVQNLWQQADKKRRLGDVFNLARTYIEVLSKSDLPIKYIRYNEAGDFPNQRYLEFSARFSKEMEDKYGVLSMAYTANKRLDFTAEVDGVPVDKIIKINVSREDIKLSPGTTQQRFYTIPMDYKTMLSSNGKVQEISDDEANRLKCAGTEGDILSVPRLTWGRWNGGEGWYYVCPCSFWKYNKDKATEKWLIENGYAEPGVEMSDKMRKALKRSLPEDERKALNSLLNKISSPCGRECAVCHDKKGGLTPDGEVVKDYAVLTATHGRNKGNYDPSYANERRRGNDSPDVKWKGDESNPYGLDLKNLSAEARAKAKGAAKGKAKGKAKDEDPEDDED